MTSILLQNLDRDARRGVENVRQAAERIWAAPVHRSYTDHTVAHSERVIGVLDGLTGGMMDTDQRLSPTEILVLLSAAYLHDIGMQNERFAGGDPDQMRASHHEIAAEMIYQVFEDPANAFPIPLGDDPGLIEAVALVSKGHRQVDLGAAAYDPLVAGGDEVRLRLLAALLRFADALDMDYRRVDLGLLKVMRVPDDSKLHWWRCYYVSGVSIVDEYIRIAYRLPQSRPDYEELIVPLVEHGVRRDLDRLRDIFRAHAVKVDLGSSAVRWMRAVRPLPAAVEALARKADGPLSRPDDRAPPSHEGDGPATPAGTAASGATPRTEYHINTGGGAYIGGSVHTTGGDFVGRDQIAGSGSTAASPQGAVASRRADLEGRIRDSYQVIRAYEQTIQLSDRPEERLRARRTVDTHWAQIRGYLDEYARLGDEALPADIAEIASHFA